MQHLAPILPLQNDILPYDWGSRTAIAEMLGQPGPSPTPQAELWMGAHPRAPSRVWTDNRWRSLLACIEAFPEQTLGASVISRFGPCLPFLFKILAADRPLSIQMHPNQQQARAGFNRENRDGIPLASDYRNYRDPNDKPELVCALGPFEALYGFRPIPDTLARFDLLAIPCISEELAALRNRPDATGLRVFFHAILARRGTPRHTLIQQTLDACERLGMGQTHICPRLEAFYPGDIGLVAALLLNQLTLERFQALYLTPNFLHAYLRGTALELMANSDNVIRGGLTHKHIDTQELCALTDFSPVSATPLRPKPAGHDSRVHVYETPTPEFRLSRFDLDNVQPLSPRDDTPGPEILICTHGHAVVSAQDVHYPLSHAASVFVTAACESYQIRGVGTVFRAAVGL